LGGRSSSHHTEGHLAETQPWSSPAAGSLGRGSQDQGQRFRFGYQHKKSGNELQAQAGNSEISNPQSHEAPVQPSRGKNAAGEGQTCRRGFPGHGWLLLSSRPSLPGTRPGQQEIRARLPPAWPRDAPAHVGLSRPAQGRDYSQPPAFAWWSHESHNT